MTARVRSRHPPASGFSGFHGIADDCSDRRTARSAVRDHPARSSVSDSNYLLETKKIEVNIQGESGVINAPKVMCRIVLSNLIRNAFQYSSDGCVNIQLEAGKVKVSNSYPTLDDPVRFQPVDATHWLNRSAGVSKFHVSLGLSLSLFATAFSLF